MGTQVMSTFYRLPLKQGDNIQGQKYSRSNRHLPLPSEWDTARAIQLPDKLQLPSWTFFFCLIPTGPALLRSLFFNSSKELLLPKAMNNLWASLSMKAILSYFLHIIFEICKQKTYSSHVGNERWTLWTTNWYLKNRKESFLSITNNHWTTEHCADETWGFFQIKWINW